MGVKGLSIFILLLICTPFLFSTENYQSIEDFTGLTIEEEKLSQAEINTSSTVTIIDQNYIKLLQSESTAALLEKVIGTSIKSQGPIGSLQNLQIRGITASKTKLFLDGVPLDSSQNGVFDLSMIPVDSIKRIEIIKSGPGNLGKTQALGGMVNIITKEGSDRESPFTISFEQGSYLPQPYGSEEERNWGSLFDSQKVDISYGAQHEDLGLFVTAGGLTAKNQYTYLDESGGRQLRENAGVLTAHGGINIDYTPTDLSSLESRNLISYKSLGVPGSTTFGLTPNDRQEDMLFSTSNSFIHGTDQPFTGSLNYRYSRSFFHDDDYTDSEHTAHTFTVLAEKTLTPGESLTYTAGAQVLGEFLQSTALGERKRVNPNLYAHGSFYLADGLISVNPSLSVEYFSDMQTFSPNGSLGASVHLNSSSNLQTTISYAEQVPTFNQLYWPNFSNPSLETERGIHSDISYIYGTDFIQTESSMFIKNIYNEINFSPTTFVPENIASSLYVGTEQSVTLKLTPQLHTKLGYLYNKSFNLTGDVSLYDAPEIQHVRKHTANGELIYKRERLQIYTAARFLGATTYGDQAFIVDAGLTAHIHKSMKIHVAVDNLLNASYELSDGYPMPGTRIRLKGTWEL